jgi:hypothetical protein
VNIQAEKDKNVYVNGKLVKDTISLEDLQKSDWMQEAIKSSAAIIAMQTEKELVNQMSAEEELKEWKKLLGIKKNKSELSERSITLKDIKNAGKQLEKYHLGIDLAKSEHDRTIYKNADEYFDTLNMQRRKILQAEEETKKWKEMLRGDDVKH